MAATDGSSVPREPSAYRPSIHFGERFKDIYDEYNRHLDDEIVRTTIRNGEVTCDDLRNYRLEHTFGGVRYRLVLNICDGEVVTGHPVSMDAAVAEASGRWTKQQIADIHEFLAAKFRDDG